jgi:hypothetical protein
MHIVMANLFKAVVLFFSMVLLCSWGEKGHQKINSSAPQFFRARLKKLQASTGTLTAHSSDADNRRRVDTSEGIKHFIDIDEYKDFVENHRIMEGKQEAIQKYGNDFVMKLGTLPWVTDSVYHALVSQFRSKQWKKAVLTAADLGHYVGDGHMPLHLTVNYDGQLSGQTGIHARYESRMINRYIDSISVQRSRIHREKEVGHYIFSYMYDNYQYKDSLLNADKRAFERAGNQYDDVYFQSLWNQTKQFTRKMIANSSKSTAVLIKSAWIEAGRPGIPRSIE